MKNYCRLFVFLLMTLKLAPEAAFASGNIHITSQVLLGTVTAYTSSPKAVTASGVPAFTGVLACPRKYPFGTIFKIEGRIYECRDRLSRKYGDRFDIWKPTEIAARVFGKRKLLIVAFIPENRPTLIASSLHVRFSRY
jgi:3D (Asp-Asp-Asp) domain-containing protein